MIYEMATGRIRTCIPTVMSGLPGPEKSIKSGIFRRSATFVRVRSVLLRVALCSLFHERWAKPLKQAP